MRYKDHPPDMRRSGEQGPHFVASKFQKDRTLHANESDSSVTEETRSLTNSSVGSPHERADSANSFGYGGSGSDRFSPNHTDVSVWVFRCIYICS